MAKISIKEEQLKEQKFYRQLYIILGFGCVLYFFFPFVFNVSFSNNLELWQMVMRTLLIGVYPFYTFIACFLNTRYYGFKWYIPVMLGVYFIPSAIMMFGYTAIPYAFAYVAFGFFGSLGATMTLKRIERMRNKKEKISNEQTKQSKQSSTKGRRKLKG